VDGKAADFSAIVGADDRANRKTVSLFYVICDRKVLFENGDMKVGGLPKQVKVRLTGIKRLGLLVV
jgi:alpha-galactosidase